MKDKLILAVIADNTLVIFASDNGCAHYIGVMELAEKERA